MVPGRIPINFAVVGVQKAATSTLHALLAQHPAAARTAKKELHFFDDESRDWDRPDYSTYSARRTAPGQTLAGDATPVYLFWPPALPRMRAYSPEIRLLAVFRDPVERALSHWMMQVERTRRTPSFDTVVQKALDSEEPHVPPDGWRTVRSRTRSMVARGFYGHQLQRALEVFPRDQWLLLDFLDLVEKQDAVLGSVTDFLEVGPFAEPPTQEQRRKSAPLKGIGHDVPSAALLERLAAAYADDLQTFERLSGISTSRWPTTRLLDGTLEGAAWAARLQRKMQEA